MPKKTFPPEQIIGRLRQIAVLIEQGKKVPREQPHKEHADESSGRIVGYPSITFFEKQRPCAKRRT